MNDPEFVESEPSTPALISREHAMNILGEMSIRTARDRRAIAQLTTQKAEQEARAIAAEEQAGAIAHLRNEIDALQRSWTYRLMAPMRTAAQIARRAALHFAYLRKIKGVAARAVRRAPDSAVATTDDVHLAQQAHRSAVYAPWRRRFVELDAYDRQLIGQHIAHGGLGSIDVLLLVDSPGSTQVASAIDGLRSQQLTTWEAWISFAPGCDTSEIRDVVDYQVGVDERLHLADHDTLTSFVSSTPLLITTSSTTLHEHALYLFATAASDGAQLAYADAELRDDKHDHLVPIFKPEYSPIYQEATGYIGDTILLANMDAVLHEALSEIDLSSAGASLVLHRLAPHLSRGNVRRIPFVVQTNTRDMLAYVHHPGIDSASKPRNHVAPPATRVTIVIPTRDRLDFLQPCVTSVFERTDYPRELVEIIIVDNGSTDAATLAYLDQLSGAGIAKVLRDDGAFNYPRLNNSAADVATGEVLLLLNNDTTILDPNWLRRMVAHAVLPAVGAVGGKLLYPDGSVQHGGVVLGVQGVAAHVNHKLFGNDLGYEPVSDFTHETSAVTAACLAIRTEVYRSLGGLDERLAVAFNDIDMCCAALAAGLTNIYIGDALIVHHESKSRGYDVTPEQVATFFYEAFTARSKHIDLYRSDAFYNPNWSFVGTHQLADPSRASRPWQLARRRANAVRTILVLVDEGDLGKDLAFVIDLQARHLTTQGHRVIVGRPQSNGRLESTPYEQATINDEFEAAQFAVTSNADLVLMHSTPFYGVPRWIGHEQVTIAVDYGARPAQWSADPMERLSSAASRKFGMALANVRLATSPAVREESQLLDTELLPLGNDHLGRWSEALVPSRTSLRSARGWRDKLVVLTISPDDDTDGAGGAGADTYFALAHAVHTFNSALAERVAFVRVQRQGQGQLEPPREGCPVEVITEVSDTSLVGLLAAADLYIDTSSWHGRDLGIGVAMAYGLPIVARDVPAHRVRGIATAQSVAAFAEMIARASADFADSDVSRRVAQVVPWSEHLAHFSSVIQTRSRPCS